MTPCLKCGSTYTYEMDPLMVCPECAYEWNPNETDSENSGDSFVVKDAHGNILQNGDTVIVIKDLPVKGASKSIKVGTKVTGIRLVDSEHNIDCKVPGFGSMGLKSEFVKKA